RQPPGSGFRQADKRSATVGERSRPLPGHVAWLLSWDRKWSGKADAGLADPLRQTVTGPARQGHAGGEVGELDAEVHGPDPDKGRGAGAPSSRLSASVGPGDHEGIHEGVEAGSRSLRQPTSDLYQGGSTGE